MLNIIAAVYLFFDSKGLHFPAMMSQKSFRVLDEYGYPPRITTRRKISLCLMPLPLHKVGPPPPRVTFQMEPLKDTLVCHLELRHYFLITAVSYKLEVSECFVLMSHMWRDITNDEPGIRWRVNSTDK